MDLLDEIDTVPATPGIIVEILASGLLNRLLALTQQSAQAQYPLTTTPPPAPAQQTPNQNTHESKIFVSSPKYLSQAEANNPKVTQIMHYATMQSIARMPAVMNQIDSLNDTDAEQRFTILLKDF